MRKILILTATHGDEGFSVPVLEKIEQAFSKTDYSYDWIIANPKALESNKRMIDVDLNRSAPGNPNSQYYEERQAAKILKMAKDYDIVIDIHGSIAECGVTTIVPLPTEENLNLAQVLELQRNVIWYAPESDERGPLVQHVGCPAIEIECGPKDTPEIASELYEVLAKLLEGNRSGLLDSIPDIKKSQTLDFYSVYGLELGPHRPEYKDFNNLRTPNGEEFYPYMANQYPNVKYYKMKKINIGDINRQFDFSRKAGKVIS